MTEIERETPVPDVVDDNNTNKANDYIWCPKKEFQIQSELCDRCDEKNTCSEYIRLSEEDRTEKANALDKEIESLKVSVFDSYFGLGQTLKEVREGMYYKELGFLSLDEYADKRHGFRYRKASYLIAIVENCEAAGLTKEDVRGIEWGKMKELPELTEDNRADWLKKAAELSVEDLKGEVKKSKGEDLPEKKITMTFAFAEGQKEVVDRALEIAARLTGSEVKSFHLQILAEEFLSTYSTEDHAAVARFNNLYMDGGEKE